MSIVWTSLWETELSQQHPHLCLDWKWHVRDLLSLPSGQPAASFSCVSTQTRHSELAGRTFPSRLTLGTCCLLLSTSCLTQLSTARYTSSSDGTLRLSLEMRSSTCRAGWKGQVSVGTVWEERTHSHPHVTGPAEQHWQGQSHCLL